MKEQKRTQNYILISTNALKNNTFIITCFLHFDKSKKSDSDIFKIAVLNKIVV